MRARFLATWPLLLTASGCGASLRGGPGLRSIDTHSSAHGQVLIAGGAGDADDRLQMTYPLALNVGKRLDGSRIESSFETGFEFSAAGRPLGGRGGFLIGAGLKGTTGAYLGLRGGPTLTFSEVKRYEFVPTLTLEGIAAVGLGGALGHGGIFGVNLAFGFDLFGAPIRIPSGRPLRDSTGHAWLAAMHTADEERPIPLALRKIPAEQRELIGTAWLEEARAEHASIAAFVRLGLELDQLGAPFELLKRCHLAALDEVNHTADCLALAARYLGYHSVPAQLPEVVARHDISWPSLGRECWLDGCLGEGSAAQLLAVRAARSVDPIERRSLARMAREEATHARLAWDILAWCEACGGDDVRDAVHEARPSA